MAVYIDKENIKLNYSGLAKIAPNDFIGMAKYFADQIKAIPAADVSPVRLGRWEKYFHSYFGRHQCVCSECKNDDYWKKNFCYGYEKYCPNCGAKMDGEKGE